jgi:hypothetical protein
MGASADQIEREIRETRDRMDENLGVLEDRAVSNAFRYGRVALIALVVAGGSLGGFLLFRRMRRPSIKDRLEGLSPEALRGLAVELGARVKNQMPSVTVTVNEKKEKEPGPVQSILRRVAPTLIGTASTAVIEKVTRQSDGHEGRHVVTAHE